MIDYLFTPKNFHHDELAKVGVKIIDAKAWLCVCLDCGEDWNVPEELPEGFWQCPNRCNVLKFQIRSSGPDWVLWELPDGTPFVGHIDENDNVELSELEPVPPKLYDEYGEFLEEGEIPQPWAWIGKFMIIPMTL